jgi:Domain of unknown function (DUF4351)/Putative transposase, YhgA-like
MIDHDRLFKELLSTFFLEFLELFLPDLARQIEPDSVRFLQQEYFVDVTAGEEKVIDLLVEVRQAGEAVAFLIHLEAQASSKANFARRMFFYFALLHQHYLQRVYPIGERSLILRLLPRRVGELSEPVRSQIDALSVPQLEALAEALLDFEAIADLETWLQAHQ